MSHDAEHIINRPAEVASVLNALQRQRSPITIRFKGVEQSARAISLVYGRV